MNVFLVVYILILQIKSRKHNTQAFTTINYKLFHNKELVVELTLHHRTGIFTPWSC